MTLERLENCQAILQSLEYLLEQKDTNSKGGSQEVVILQETYRAYKELIGSLTEARALLVDALTPLPPDKNSLEGALGWSRAWREKAHAFLAHTETPKQIDKEKKLKLTRLHPPHRGTD